MFCQSACFYVIITKNKQREKLANQVISVNRKKYAVGLFWQPVVVGRPVRNYARMLSRSIDKKLNLYTEFHAMVGLGSRSAGHKSGMPSAAAEILNAFPEYSSFLAVFRAGAVFYLVAVRNGVILEDKIFASEADARGEYARLAEIPDWGAFIAPGEWGMPRAVERTLAELVSGRGRGVLRAISRFRAVAFSVALLALFVVGFMTIFQDSLVQVMTPRPQISEIDPELAAEYKRQLEEKSKQLDQEFNIEKQPEPEPLVMPYDNLPDVQARAELCYQAIGFLMQPIPGWNQVKAKCGETHASVEFNRGFGTLGDFYNIATDLMPGAFVQEISEDALVARATLPALPIVASQDERDAETIVRDITTLFQSINTTVDTEIVIDVLSNGVETAQVNIVEVAAASKLTPMQFMQIFADFGGVYMTGCEWNATDRTWNYEVIIYAK